MGKTIEVREAGEADRDVLLRFHRSLYEGHRNAAVSAEAMPLIEYRDYDAVVEADLDALLSDRSAHLLIAECDDTPVGYITGRTSIEPQRLLTRRAVIEDWYVDPEHRGHGAGATLLEALEERFRGRGCEVVESGTWSANDVGRKAHDALGFHEIRTTYRKRITQP